MFLPGKYFYLVKMFLLGKNILLSKKNLLFIHDFGKKGFYSDVKVFTASPL